MAIKAKKIQLILLLIAILGNTILSAQKNDPVLFKVADTPVQLSEFNYIYTKTNGDKADFSKASLDEYLDLYVKFKLKVERAKELKLDTIPSLIRELEGYRRQLADSYLIDKEVTETLIKEAYERVKQDVDVHHIMVAVSANASPADSLAAYNKALDLKKQLEGGGDFAELAKANSADPSAKTNGGNIGFLTALLPNGFYNFEKTIYTLPEGKISNPVRTNRGYHVIKVSGRRPAYGEIEAAHILLRTKDQDPDAVKVRIDSIYRLLKGGADFGKLAQQLSEDKSSAEKGGYIGFFGINRYEKPIEHAAFNIQTDGAYAEPIQSSVGWHIIRRISKKDIQPFQIEKSRLERAVKKDARFALAKDAMINRIKKNAGLKENDQVLAKFVASLPDTFLTFRWKAPKTKSTETLFSLGDNYTVSLGDFTDYLDEATRKRIRLGQNQSVEAVVNTLYTDFLNETCLKYEETQLEKKYPDFKALMREYEEGILLFEATKQQVWDKASQDTVGLEKFFETIKGKYRWTDRAVVQEFTVSTKDELRAKEVARFAVDNSVEDVFNKYNSETTTLVSSSKKTYEKDKKPELRDAAWQEGTVTPVKAGKRQTYKFLKIIDLLPPANKTLQEARGYVVADYQDELERQWVEELRKRYKVEINQKAFNSLVKK